MPTTTTLPYVMQPVESPRRRLMHRSREQEVAIIFERTPNGTFPDALELGAGDCYQSRFLKPHVGKLTCTDYDETLLTRSDPEITYMGCDAEKADVVFAGRKFDLVYSSNMLPHTPDQQAVFRSVAKVMHDDGVFIVIVPSPLWKILKLAAFYPRLVLTLPARVFRKLLPRRPSQDENKVVNKNEGPSYANNPKALVDYGRLRKILFPVPVGVYPSNTAEVLCSRRSVWIEKFRKGGWEMIDIRRGPFICGDLNRFLNDLCARIGLATENIYIAKKARQTARHEALFR